MGFARYDKYMHSRGNFIDTARERAVFFCDTGSVWPICMAYRPCYHFLRPGYVNRLRGGVICRIDIFGFSNEPFVRPGHADALKVSWGRYLMRRIGLSYED